jgi:hypothetical protein
MPRKARIRKAHILQQRRGPKPKGTDDQKAYLESFIPGYLTCQASKKWHKFWPPVFQGWLDQWPPSETAIQSAKAEIFAESQSDVRSGDPIYSSLEDVPDDEASARMMEKEKHVSDPIPLNI